jgi:hypothetical protein
MNKKRFSDYVKAFDFKSLFIDLGWDNHDGKVPITIDDNVFEMQGIVQKKGFVIALCPSCADGKIPEGSVRKKIENAFSKYHHEHLIIYENAQKTRQVWQYVVQEPDKPRKTREIQYSIDQDPEILYQRSRGLLFKLDEEENITLIDVTTKVRDNFAQNTEQVTKKFYVEFKKQHNAFLGFISGIDDLITDEKNKNKQWYASLMLNRLMFCYFIQKRGYLDHNIHYLREKLQEVKAKAGNDKFYNFYRGFLLELFHKGLGQPEKTRHLSVDLGTIPYLDGGLFDVHELERQFDKIDIADEAFEKIFGFFDQWNWHLDTRVESSGKDINPDVIGYIFEKYINDRAAMGAYYTKEDITEYISKNTIIPCLFDKVKKKYPVAFAKDAYIWTYLKNSGDTYIYDAVKKGISQEQDLFADLPEEIRAGFLPDLEKKTVTDETAVHLWEIRKCWNRKAPEKIALPTETYRELIERRKRYVQLKTAIEKGEITEINDFITHNLNIRQFVQDILENIDDPEFIKYFYQSLQSITILDPTCGSGAFLFAALNILEPLYETCIERMEQFTSEKARKYRFFHEVLAEANSVDHPNLNYYIYKTIILNNLYGVDIMNEAVEIAKLRLFLKMVGAVDLNTRKPNLGLEPLPDVDFNIRAGNTLVGFAREQTFKHVIINKLKLLSQKVIEDFEDEFMITAKAYKDFQSAQFIEDKGQDDYKKTKDELRTRLNDLNEKLNEYLASTYGIDKNKQNKKYDQWLETHQPFHWLAEFYEIIKDKGGFDVIIGNPPYVEVNNIDYSYSNTLKTGGNLYALILEASDLIRNIGGYTGMIVPLSGHSTKRMMSLVEHYYNIHDMVCLYNLSCDAHPGILFPGVKFRLAISIVNKKIKKQASIYTTKYKKWYIDERNYIFEDLSYNNNDLKYGTAIPKISSKIHLSIMNKLNSLNKKLFSETGSVISYYHNTPVNWIRSHSYIPFFRSERDGHKKSAQLKIIKFHNKTDAICSSGIISSSLFFIYYITVSDCYHLNKPELINFPFNKNSYDLSVLEKATKELENDLKIKSKRRVYFYQTSGRVEYDEFYLKKSKPFIDKIDTILAKFYGFTQEELDFIINYDIKYRMGSDLGAYIEGTLGQDAIADSN